DSLSEIMDAVWAQLLPLIVRGNFAPVSTVTMPHTLAALLAYANAEEAFRRGDYETAHEEYNRVVAADSSFAIGYFRRALVVAQVDPREETFRAALAGAQRHHSGLEPADSVLLEGYQQLLERGDGRAALARFKTAASLAPDQPQVWFALGEFYYHFGALFDQGLHDAELAFDSVLGLAPDFAPAVAHLISFAVARNDRDAMERLIRQYEGFGTPSVVTETVGIVDTLLLHGLTAKVALQKTLLSHSFTALEYLAFQVQIFGSPEQRRGPGRDVLDALERKAATDSERVYALRFGVAADLGEEWVDSARARLARADTPATMRERDMWLVLSNVTGLDSLGDWRSAAERLAAQVAAERRGGELVHWMLARLDRDRTRHLAALDRLAADSAPLPLALRLDLDARRSLAARDSASALGLWQAATERYAVLRVPFDLAASLWWLRRDLAQLARARGDTALAARTCDSFASIIGYVDLPVQRHASQFCPRGP
ncbi:MAG TPA: hypothetical protein VFI79_06670, partial [Gemmatimonadales bacterium]|nr:hypothetical protein [Gemmatimonadales bacterium]